MKVRLEQNSTDMQIAQAASYAIVSRAPVLYRGHTITFYQPPIPTTRFDWQWVADDYDGPEDDRVGAAESLRAAMQEIDDSISEHDGDACDWCCDWLNPDDTLVTVGTKYYHEACWHASNEATLANQDGRGDEADAREMERRNK